ncbi:MAG: 3-hydroxyacyl-CoA dehydrogenase family protein [Candidatus Hydrogenedentota bacterium]|nr:MAG: 3-hydroxyacyl-CoA dehydrogenase family protein [Candidatus Hydrogenedentota bacterium]
MDAHDVKSAAVIGAGVMGHSIAQVFARAGIEVGLVDLDEKTLEHAMRLVEHSLDTLARVGKVRNDEIPAILDRIHPSTDLVAAADGVDFVLEAVVEVPDVKSEVFSRLEEICPDNTVLASNTSGLDIFDIVQLKSPGRFVVTHWFAPPHIIPLVEVVPGPDTSPEAITFAANLMERLGKRPVVMKEFVQSFIVNRIQNNIGLAVWEILQNGWATPEEIDLAVKLSLGVRLPIVGVVQRLDFTGLDLVYQIMQNYGMEDELISEKVAKGHLGAKTAKGIYDYGGRSEEEILRKRDERYFAQLDHLEAINAFEPI